MAKVSTITYVVGAVEVIAAIVGGYIATKSVYSRDNSIAATELIAKLEKLRESDKEEFNKRIDSLVRQHQEDEKLHNENSKAIADLQGQLKTYKELPLLTLAEGIKKIATSNDMILKQLELTAGIAAEDRDVLTNQNAHIRTEVTKIMDKTLLPSKKKENK